MKKKSHYIEPNAISLVRGGVNSAFMKAFQYTIILLLLLPLCSQAQSDERSKAMVQEAQVQESAAVSYVNQVGYWETMIQNNASNATFWYNYYSSVRFADYTTKTKSVAPTTQSKLNEIVEGMEENVSSSYEYHFVKYWNSNYDVNEFHHLEKAYALKPNAQDLYDDFIAHYELTNDSKGKAKYCKKWLDSNQLDPQLIEYNRNVLKTLPKNAVFIANGEMDTYPIWILQEVEGFRTDVQVLNLDLLAKKEYRKRILKEAGLQSNVGFSATDPKKFLFDLADNNYAKGIYFGLTMNPTVLHHLQNRLFLTGLAFRYDPVTIDNMPELVSNWENKMSTSYLNTAAQDDAVTKLNMNYIMPALLLYSHYTEQGATAKAKQLEDIIRLVAMRNGKLNEVTPYLKQ